ncbi:MAG TPA: type II toxin-antitoxin system HicB family antitoxin [Ktedonobacterales bacterium]|nr:type II toxin-antitoxin system HicB family antitoxin [Ktedonobacterales bacterium]
MQPHYTMMIAWSDKDSAYLVRLPEWEADGRIGGPVTDGATYAEAAANGQDALDELIEVARQHGEELPPVTAAA